MCEHCDHSKDTSFVSGVLMGAVAGAVLGLLLAPEKGEEVRRKLKAAGTQYAEKGKAFLDDVEDEAEVLKEKVRPIVRNIQRKAAPIKEALVEKAEEFENMAEDVKEKLNDEKDILKKRFFSGIK